MRIDVLTLFPGMFSGPLTESILQRAKEQGLLDVRLHDLRDFGLGKHKQVDDTPYGGGAGMVFRPDVVIPAIEAVMDKIPDKFQKLKVKKQKPYRIYLSPRGRRLTQTKVEKLSREPWILLLAGHYEGIDERVIAGGWIDEEISIGDYVLTGGELPAMVLIDALARQIPGVLGKEESAAEESFSKTLGRKREYPQYTRPEEFRGQKVPEILLSGNHKKIEEWRRKNVK
ncbi:MAG: tRNA (guanosine(37)-N1)-methyltransferase TrmD [Patescibacteria group bacterium]